MSYLRTAKATCGRMAKKPNESEDNPNYEDDTSIPLQDQIDNLRAKISLKEKYNKALRDEVHETNAGAATMISELVSQNIALREELENEKNAEKFAVKKALRSYRLFQLAVQDKNVDGVIAWLDDKIFDASKTLNEGFYLMKRMQAKILEAERAVAYLEKCPIPGTEPWEIAAEENRNMLESAIEHMKANRDAARLLNKKYAEILYFLKSEKGKWPYIMLTLEKTLAQQRSELASFEVMLEDAKRFRDEAQEKLKLTEEEASQNRKQRRQQMNKMKKSVEKALQANTTKFNAPAGPGPATTPSGRRLPGVSPSNKSQMRMSEILIKGQQDIKSKQQQVLDFENRANKLVESMRVRDLRFCPKRLESVRMVGEVLSNELALKLDLRELLLKHKYRLELILQAFRYTGCKQQEEFLEELEARELECKLAEDDIAEKEVARHKKGAYLIELRVALIGLEELLNPKKKGHAKKLSDIRLAMKKILDHVKELVSAVEELRSAFSEDSKPQRSYAPYVKYSVHHRHIRIGAPEEMEVDDDSDQDMEVDSKIPNREELKAKSERFHAQALLRRGIAH